MDDLKKRLIEKLIELGLSQNEAKAYEALIELDVAAPLEIAAISDIPVSKIYLVLSELERKGLIEVQHGRPKLCRAVDPKRALRLLTEKYFKVEEEALRLIGKISSESSRSLDTGTFWVVKGRRNIIDKIRHLLESAHYSLAIASSDKLILKVSNNLRNAVEKDINISLVIYKTNDRITKRLVDYFKSNAMVRVRDIIAPSIFIVDDKKALTYITETLYRGVKRIETALLVEDRDFLPVFGAYYRFISWYPSKCVSNLEDYFSKPRTYCMYFRAVEDAAYLLSKGIKPFARAEGWLITNTKEKIVLEGRIIEAYQSSDKSVYNLTLISKDGKKYVLGGKRCVIEDVETDIITIYPKSS